MNLDVHRGIAAAVLALAGLAVASSASAAMKADPGRRLFLQCQACHSVAVGEPNKVGPNLHGIIGAKAATRAGYNYSPGLAASGIVWTEAELDRWLTKPSAVVAGTKMLYPGLPDHNDRATLIAYLKGVTR